MLVTEIVLGVLLLAVLALLAIGGRRRLLQRGGGTVDVSLRLRTSRDGGGWVLGVGRFDGDDLQWYRVFSLAPRPRRTLSRRDLRVTGQRPPSEPERYALLNGAVVMECASEAGPVQLALDARAVTGFLAWLEARPPGAHLPSG